MKFIENIKLIINDRNNGQYGAGKINESPIKVDTEVIKVFLCDYADAYILVTGDITVVGGGVDTKVAFKNCHPFVKSEIRLNDERVESADNLDLIMNIYNLIEYSDNYEDSAASLHNFKRQEPLENNNDLTVVSSSFSYKSDLLGKPTNLDNDGTALTDANLIWKNSNYCSFKIYFIFL